MHCSSSPELRPQQPWQKENQKQEQLIDLSLKRPIDAYKVASILRSLVPMSLPSQSRDFRIQLWKCNEYGLTASIQNQKGELIRIIPQQKIRNFLHMDEDGEKIAQRLATLELRRWEFSYHPELSILIILPYLEAAGKERGIIDRPIRQNPLKYVSEERLMELMFMEKKGNKPERDFKQKPGDPNAFISEKRGIEIHIDRPGQGNHQWKPGEPPHVDITFTSEKLKELKQKKEDFLNRSREEKKKEIASRKLSDRDAKKEWHQFEKKLNRQIADYESLKKKWRFAFGDKKPDHGPKEPKPFAEKTPAKENFKEIIQQAKLTGSYRSSNPGNPIPEKGWKGGDIGGVACNPDYIEGLFDTPESLFEKDHLFCLPELSNGELPFSDGELRQILRELAIGIYVHDTVPFFSLHFNRENAHSFPPNDKKKSQENLDQFPVIHYAYQNTLVGRVLEMIDFTMKGYLNGGVYTEEFIDNWYKDPNWRRKSKSAEKELIDFQNYCQKNFEGNDSEYVSAKTLQQETRSTPLLMQYEGFKNSFRIIAKQKNYEKQGNLFIINSDFDVLYTIDISSGSQEELAKHFRKHRINPPSNNDLRQVFEIMKNKIHDHLVKFPICKKYFAMLGLINFISSYYSTLKKHKKFPLFDAVEKKLITGCPPLLPHLPITFISKEKPRLNLEQVFKAHYKNNSRNITRYFIDLSNQEDYFRGFNLLFFTKKTPRVPYKDYEPEKKNFLIDTLAIEIEKNILSLCSKPVFTYLKKENRFLQYATELFNSKVDRYEKAISDFNENGILSNKAFDNALHLQSGFIYDNYIEFDNKLIDLPEENCKILSVPSDLSKAVLEKNKGFVGGCGMDLLKNRIQPSKTASAIIRDNIDKLNRLKPETFLVLDTSSNTKRTVFSLPLMDASPWSSDDYAWMESSLFLDESNSQFVNKLTIVGAMVSKNREEFSRLVSVSNESELKQMKDKNQTTLLHRAATLPKPFYAEALIKKGLSPLDTDINGYLPIHYAAMEGCVKILELFISINKGILNAKSKNGSTALIIAIQHRQLEAVKFLIAQKPIPAMLTSGYTDLHCALHEGDKAIINAVLSADFIVSPCINVFAEEGGTPLMLACELDDANLVQALIDKKADPSINSSSLFEIAIQRNSVAVLQVLLMKVVPSDVEIEIALKKASLEIILLLETKIKLIHFKNSCQDTPLHVALRYANIPVAIYLAERGHWIKQENVEGQTPLQLAMQVRAWQVAEILIEKGAVPDLKTMFRLKFHPFMVKVFNQKKLTPSELQEYLLIAAQAGNYLAITQLLQPKGAKIEDLKGPNGWEITHYMAKADGIYILKNLCKTNGDILNPLRTEGNKTLAYIAAENQSSRVLDFLLKEIQRRNLPLEKHFEDKHLFYAILEKGDEKTVKMALELFPDKNLANALLDNKGTHPVHIACKIGSNEILQLLEKYQADLKSTDKNGWTPLSEAIQSKSEKCVTFLLEHDVPVGAPDLYLAVSSIKTILSRILEAHPSQKVLDEALYLAVSHHNLEAFKSLSELGATFIHVTSDGWTPTLLASSNGDKSILELLLRAPNKDERLVGGNNALHLACMKGHVPCIELLLQNGFSPKIPNGLGKTPIELACKSKGAVEALTNSVKTQAIKQKEFINALRRRNVEKLKTIASTFSPEEIIYLELPDGDLWGSPLHILMHFSDDVELRNLIPFFLKPYEKVPLSVLNFADSKGNTLAHFISLIGLPLLKMPGLDLSVRNHKGQTPLHIAAAKADTPILEEILKMIPSVKIKEMINAVDDEVQTPIYYALKKENSNNIKLLYKYGASLQHYDRNLWTPLIFACSLGFLEETNTLLELGADPNQTFNKVLPLHVAVHGRQHEIIRLLLSYGANIDIPTEDGLPLIHYFAQIGDVELFRLFVSMGVPYNLKSPKGQQPKNMAILNGKIEILIEISRYETDEINETTVDEEKIPSLHIAALSSYPQTVEWLLNHKANPEDKTEKGIGVLSFAMQSPIANSMVRLFEPFSISKNPKELLPAIYHSISHDQLEATKWCYSQGIPIDANIIDGNNGLHIACKLGALHCTSWFLQGEIDPHLKNSFDETTFELAAQNDSVEQFGLLLDFVDVDQTYQHGQTLMHISVKAGRLKHVIALLMRGASFNSPDHTGFTPLHIAVKEKNVDIVRLLLAIGADPKAQSLFGKTPLDLLLNTSLDPELKEENPQKKLDIEIKEIFNAFDKTVRDDDPPLHLAVKMGSLLAVLIHLDTEEIDEINNLNGEGLTPLHIAAKGGYLEIVIALLRTGADCEVKDKMGHPPYRYVESSELTSKSDLLKLLK